MTNLENSYREMSEKTNERLVLLEDFYNKKIDDLNQEIREIQNSQAELIERNSRKISENSMLIINNEDKLSNLSQNLNQNNQELSNLNDVMKANFPKEVVLNATCHDFNNNYFSVTNNGKTIKKIGNTNGVWDGFYCKDRVIFDNTIHEFSMQIQSLNQNLY